jgi:hypothetical protein
LLGWQLQVEILYAFICLLLFRWAAAQRTASAGAFACKPMFSYNLLMLKWLSEEEATHSS